MIAIPKEVQCPREACGHRWIPRTENPLTCPRCKCYLDKGKRYGKEVNGHGTQRDQKRTKTS